MLYFHTEELVAREICMEVYERLQTAEVEAYPFHYEILSKKQEYYQEYRDKRDTYESSIKIKTKDAFSENHKYLRRLVHVLETHLCTHQFGGV